MTLQVIDLTPRVGSDDERPHVARDLALLDQ